MLPIPAFKPEAAVQRGAFTDDFEGMRVFLQCLFRFGKSFRVLVPAALPQPLHGCFQAVVLDLIAKQNIHGSVEKVRHFHNQFQIGNRQLCLPLVNRSGRYAKHLGELLLCQRPFLPEHTDVLRELHFHVFHRLHRPCLYGTIIPYPAEKGRH